MAGNSSLLDEAVKAAKQKDHAGARMLLQQILKQEPNNLNAWLLAAHVVESRADAIRCFKHVLQLDPNHAYALQKLSELETASPSSVPASPPPAPQTVPTKSVIDALPKSRVASPSETHAEQARSVENLPSMPRSKSTVQKSDTAAWVVVGGGILLLFCCLVVILANAFTNGGSLFDIGQPTPTTDELFGVLYKNARATNDENLSAYMATIHPNSPGYQQTETTLQDMFAQYDLQVEFYNLSVVSLSRDEARIHFSLYTRRLRGPAFRNNTVNGIMILRPDDGVWKIYNQTVEDVQFE